MSIPEYQRILPLFEPAIESAAARFRRFIKAHPERFPTVTQHGRWQSAEPREAGWLAGCFTGLLWNLYEISSDAFWREQAVRYASLLADTGWDWSQRGGGFAAYFGAHRRWYQATLSEGIPDAALGRRLFEAALAQAELFRTDGQYLDAERGASMLTIERLLDVPLLLFAAAETQDHRLSDVAAFHCAASRRYLVRGDGSVVSAVRMDATSGEWGIPVGRGGRRAGSTWACGQAWAILGFATAGRLLDFQPWLQTARQAAEFMSERLSGEPIPRWDLDGPAQSSDRHDAAAAAITAAGLFELADAEQTVGADQARGRRRYQETALRILERLCQPDYLAGDDAAWEGVLKRGVGHLPAGWAVDESVIWGDAFFVQALRQALRVLRHGRS